MRRDSQRGSVLLMTVLILTVLTVLGAGSINFSTIESDAAVAHRQEVFGDACARAIREMLISQMKLYGAQAAPLNVTLPDADDPEDKHGNRRFITLRQGHYGDYARRLAAQGLGSAQIDALTISAVPADLSSIGNTSAQSITNQFGTSVPSAPRRMAATCVVTREDGSVREKEIEFVVSYGF